MESFQQRCNATEARGVVKWREKREELYRILLSNGSSSTREHLQLLGKLKWYLAKVLFVNIAIFIILIASWTAYNCGNLREKFHHTYLDKNKINICTYNRLENPLFVECEAPPVRDLSGNGAKGKVKKTAINNNNNNLVHLHLNFLEVLSIDYFRAR